MIHALAGQVLGAKPDHEFYRDGNEYNIVYQGHELRVSRRRHRAVGIFGVGVRAGGGT